MTFKMKAIAITLVMATISTMAMAEEKKSDLPFPGEITGSIGILSSYNLRGITNAPENEHATVQGGLDYSHDSGVYLGYWASTLGYSASPKYDRESLESNFYGGYKCKVNDDLGYTVGGTIYHYYPGWNSTGYETLLGVNYKSLSFSAQTLLNNVTFGNKGDTYFLASYEQELPIGFTGTAQLGAYFYGNDDEFVETTEDFGFRHFTVGLSHALGESGADWSLNYIVGGYDRVDTKQKNKVVLGISYGF